MRSVREDGNLMTMFSFILKIFFEIGMMGIKRKLTVCLFLLREYLGVFF